MKKLFIPLLLITTILIGCENEILIRVDDRKPTLVMNAFIDADSTNNRLFLNLTGIYGITEVMNATVEVRVNGVFKETALYIEPQTVEDLDHIPQPYYLVNTHFHPGDEVRIDARTADGEYHVWTENTVPQPITIEQIDTASTRFITSDSYSNYLQLMRYRVTFTDRSDERNFYRLILERSSRLSYFDEYTQRDTTERRKSQRMVIRDDIVLTDGQPTNDGNEMFERTPNFYGVFDDTRIANQRYSMTAYTRTDDAIYYHPYQTTATLSVDVHISLQSIDETTFYYLKALNVIDSDSYDETLMEPIRYPSNVNGGTGIVSFSSSSSLSLHLGDFTYSPTDY